MTAIETLAALAAHYEALGDRPAVLILRRAKAALEVGWECEMLSHAGCRQRAALLSRWTGRRDQVARALGAGMTYTEAAKAIGVHENTVKYHREALALELGVTSLGRLVAKLGTLGYGPDPDPLVGLALALASELRRLPALAELLGVPESAEAQKVLAA